VIGGSPSFGVGSEKYDMRGRKSRRGGGSEVRPEESMEMSRELYVRQSEMRVVLSDTKVRIGATPVK
jgi:hypothetical protein